MHHRFYDTGSALSHVIVKIKKKYSSENMHAAKTHLCIFSLRPFFNYPSTNSLIQPSSYHTIDQLIHLPSSSLLLSIYPSIIHALTFHPYQFFLTLTHTSFHSVAASLWYIKIKIIFILPTYSKIFFFVRPSTRISFILPTYSKIFCLRQGVD